MNRMHERRPPPAETEMDIETIDIEMPDGEWSDQWLDQIADSVVGQLSELVRDL